MLMPVRSLFSCETGSASTYRSTSPAMDAAVSLAAIAGDVDHDVTAGISWIVSGVASMESVHAARSQVKSSAHADNGFQHVWKTLIRVAIVEVPPFIVAIGQPRVGRGGREVLVEEISAPFRNRLIDDREPLVDHRADTGVIAWSCRRERHLHSVHARPLDDVRTILWPVVRERRSEQNRVLSVRVEMHTAITSC